MRDRARRFGNQQVTQPLRVIVVVGDDDLSDACLAQPQQDRRESRREACVDDERKGRKQHTDPLDLLRAHVAGQSRVHHRHLQGPAQDCVHRLLPRADRNEVEPVARGVLQAAD